MADFAGATCAPVTLAVVVLPIPHNLRINIDTVSKSGIHRHTMRSTIVGMTSLTEQLPYVYAFPDALGTGLLVPMLRAGFPLQK